MDINSLHSSACSGDPKAVEALFELLTSRFRLFAHLKIRNKTEAEEVVQDALMTVYAKYGEITFTTSFAAWACKVLNNKMLDYYRRKKRESERIDDAVSQNPDSPGVSIGSDPELKRRLIDCFRKICRRNVRYARIMNLHYLGYKTGEICDRIQVKPETLYSALSKARAMLAACLEKGDVK